MLAVARLRALDAGEVVARRGDVPSHWMGVVRGALKASAGTADGRISSHVLAAPSQWAMSEELLESTPLRHDVVAISDTLVVVTDAPIYRKLLASSAEFCGFLLREMSQQRGRLLERIDRERRLPKVLLVAQTIAELVHELGREGHGAIALNQEDIAEFVGLSRQAVNQALKRLQVEGLVCTHYSRVEVPNVQDLRDFSRRDVL